MKYKPWVRLLSLLILFVMLVGSVPLVIASNKEMDLKTENVEESALDDTEPEHVPAAEAGQEAIETVEEEIHTFAAAMRTASATGTMGKSECVYFGYYESPRWYCNRYQTTGEHSAGHYCTTDSMHYHTMNGELAYCIQPNCQSAAGKTYSGYDADSADGSSYWMLELDGTQRDYIEKILAFGYPSVDRGYSQQIQFAATQTLIWEVVFHQRYASGIQYSSDYGLFSKVYATLGADYQACYDGILNSISTSDGTVPSFAGSSSYAPATVNLTLNTSTGCYEASVWDGNGVLGYYDFAASGVTFTKSGNTLYISVPANSAASVKGQTITGTSTQKNMATSNPVIWENPYYQTVITSGGAEYAKAYIRLNWEDTGTLKLVKTVSDSSVSRKGWTFYFRNNSTGQTITKTTDGNGEISVTGLTAGTTYTVTEQAYEGYIQPAAQTVTIQAGKTTELKFYNVRKQWRATVTKVDAETGTAQGNTSLDGAEYTLYKSGTAVKVYTVENGGFITDLYPCTNNNGVYTLKETKSPPGYKLDPTVYKLTTSYANYSAAENNIKLTVSEEIVKGKITLEKWAVNTVSGAKQPEKGATFNIWLKSAGSYDKAKAAERDIITIGSDGKGTSKDLPYGTYCIQQITTWDGYDLDTTIYERSIDETTSRANNTLSLHNDIWTGQITIAKVDGDTKEPLAGAEFTLTGSDNSKVVLVTDDTGKAVFENLVYGV